MQMDEGLDTGDICLVQAQPIHADDTAGSLHDRLAAQGAALVVEAIARLQAGRLPRTPQPADGATYAQKLGKDEAAIDWRDTAAVIERRLRAFDPFPGATATIAGQVTKVWRARLASSAGPAEAAPPGTVTRCDARELRVACASGELSLLELQPPGGRRIATAAFLQTPVGRQLRAGRPLDMPGS